MLLEVKRMVLEGIVPLLSDLCDWTFALSKAALWVEDGREVFDSVQVHVGFEERVISYDFSSYMSPRINLWGCK